MGTKIYITPPGGAQEEIKVYSKCSVTLSGTSRAGSFSLELPDSTGLLVDAFPVGSDVLILQDDNVFRGWILNSPKKNRWKNKIYQHRWHGLYRADAENTCHRELCGYLYL